MKKKGEDVLQGKIVREWEIGCLELHGTKSTLVLVVCQPLQRLKATTWQDLHFRLIFIDFTLIFISTFT